MSEGGGGRLWRIGFAGLGNVNRALLSMLEERRAELSTRWGLEFRVTMAATLRRGAVVDAAGLETSRLLLGEWPAGPEALRAEIQKYDEQERKARAEKRKRLKYLEYMEE